MDQDQFNRDFIRNANENYRNNQLVSSIQLLADKQKESNEILQQQCDALQKRNEMLEIELKNSRKATKTLTILNFISATTAAASLISTILIAIFTKS